MRRLLVIAVALLVAACAGGDGIEPTHRGTYLGGQGAGELNMFTPCGDTAMLWVTGDPVTVERLRKAHASMTRSQFQPIYIEMRGRTIPRGRAQLEPLYNGIVHVDTVLTRSSRVPMTCVPKLRPKDPEIG
jgi:hypothetical protein